VTNAVKLALKAILRFFGQAPAPTTRGAAPPVPYPEASASEASAAEAPDSPQPAPEPAGTGPEPETPFSPAPARARTRPAAEAQGEATAREEPGDVDGSESIDLEAVDGIELEAAAGAEPEAAAGAEPEAAAGAEPGSPPQSAGGPGSTGAEPEPEPEPVLLGGSAPRRARPGDVILAQFTAYVAGFEEQARKELGPEDASSQVRLGVETDCRWPVGTRVTARCTVRGFTMQPLTETFVWDGECRTVAFDIEVPADAQPRSVVILMEAFVHDRADAPDAVQVGRLRLPLEIGDVADDEPRQRVDAETPRTAFASYASEDRLDVLERVSSIERSAGLKVFMDVIDLRMGDRWEPELSSRIASSDRFLLFWSEHAAGKKWVTWEWQQALDAKGEDALELHLLRTTPIELIPERLRHFHFNDIYLQARDAELYRREQAAKAAAANAPDAGG
jgi:hypothetical protein